MISLAQNRSIFNAFGLLIDKVRDIESPLTKMRSIYLSKGAKNPQGENIECNLAANEAKATRADELINAWAQITHNEKVINDCMSGLEKLMFMTQHKLRKPVTNMVGIAAMLDKQDNSPEEIRQIVKYMQKSAAELDTYTRELTGMISELSQKSKK